MGGQETVKKCSVIYERPLASRFSTLLCSVEKNEGHDNLIAFSKNELETDDDMTLSFLITK